VFGVAFLYAGNLWFLFIVEVAPCGWDSNEAFQVAEKRSEERHNEQSREINLRLAPFAAAINKIEHEIGTVTIMERLYKAENGLIKGKPASEQ